MNTTYDEIYTEFITNTKTDNINLPKTNTQMYNSIHSAIRHYNVRLRDDLSFNDESETVDRTLNNDELILISHYLRLSFLENQWIEYTTTWNPFEKDIGIKNYQSQNKAMQSLVELEKKEIEAIIFSSMEL
ncbi:hypothetical protein BSK66_26740 [Paenibacillus odorifer]|uniref:hypothetical protein n=1 Tax=Paenibacillus TaxID=44249 RepID=UPI0003E20133|nr:MULTISPECIES: hypothetical protein [Paenibacillus]ETT49346.1 hypothetical protein C171_23775 [Paenibacillus sp. FSL H8-237]OME49558.1 hypothetical protein BSK66_26740 [Paenibacillus odorifer]